MVFGLGGGGGNEMEVRITGDASGLQSAIAGGALPAIGSLEKAVAGAGIAMSALAVGGMVKATRGAMDLQTATSEVSTLMGEGQDAAAIYGEDIARLSKEYAAHGGQVEVTEGLYQTLSAGFTDSADAIHIMEQSMKAGTAGLADTETAVDVLTTVINAYGMEAEDAESISDVLFETVRRGKTTFPELASTMGRVVPIASELGVGVEEVGAAAATLTARGQSTDEAMTAIRSAMVTLMKPSESLAGIINDLGYESGQALVEAHGFGGALELIKQQADESGVNMADAVPNIRAMQAIFPLAGEAAGDFQDNLDAMNNSTGATEEAFGKMSDTASFKWRQAMNEIEDALIQTGQAFLPFVTTVAESVAGLIGTFNDLNNATGGMLGAVTLVGVAIGGLIPAIGLLMMTAGPVIPIIKGLAAAIFGLGAPVILAVAAIGLLYLAWTNNWFGIQEIVGQVIASIRETINLLFAWLVEFTNTMLELARQFWAMYGEDITEIVLLWVQVVTEAIQGFFEWINPYVEQMLADAALFWSLYGDEIIAIVNFFVDIIKGTFEFFMNFLRTTALVILDLMHGDFSDAWMKIKQFLFDTWDRMGVFIEKWFRDFYNMAVEGLENVLKGFIDWGKELIGASVIPDIFNAITKFLSKWFGKFIGFIKKQLTNSLNFWINVLKRTFDAVKKAYDRIKSTVQTILRAVGSFVKTQLTNSFNFYKNILTKTFNAVKKAYNRIKSTVQTVLRAVVSFVKKNLNNMFTFYRNIFNKIRAIVQKVLNAIASIIRKKSNQAKQGAISAFNAMKSRILGIVNSMKSRITGVFNSIKRAASNVISKARDAASRARSIVSNAPTRVGNFLGMQHGGLVTGPTFAMIGEGREDEAVLPLSKLNRLVERAAMTGATHGGGGTGSVNQYNITVNAETPTGGRLAGRALVRELRSHNFD